MKKLERATSLFEEGFNCAQSLLATYGVALGIDYGIALKIASAFGGGGARTGETCGAVTGAFMIIGLKYGAVSSEDKEAREKTYLVAVEFIKRFRSRNKSLSCRQLLGFDISTAEELSPGIKEVISRKCPKFIHDSAEIIEDIVCHNSEI